MGGGKNRPGYEAKVHSSMRCGVKLTRYPIGSLVSLLGKGDSGALPQAPLYSDGHYLLAHACRVSIVIQNL